MKFCEHEPQIITAAAQGQLPGAFARHIESCDACSEALAAVRNLRALAEESFDTPLPSAAFVWWKATLVNRRRARERVIQIERSVYAGALLLFLFLGIQYFPSVRSLPPILLTGLGLVGFMFIAFVAILYVWSLRIARERL